LSESRRPEWRTAERPDLRTGVWTRLGHSSVLGDEATEAALGTLAERARSAARAQGYAVGWAQGREEALNRAAEAAALAERQRQQDDQRRETEHRAAVAGLVNAAADLSAAVVVASTRISDQATELAFELTRTLVGHELSLATDPGAGVVARVLAGLPADAGAVVRLHPDAAGSAAVRLLEDHDVRVVADSDLDRHDAIVETEMSAIDLRVTSALERLREVLG
jgi:flagellar assembly protein FliH